MNTNKRSSNELCETLLSSPNRDRPPSLVPILVEGLQTGNPEGSNPQDMFLKTLLEASPETYEAIMLGWEAMPDKIKKQRYPMYPEDTFDAPWVERLALQSTRLLAHRRTVAQRRRETIRREFRRALTVGPANWQPSEELQRNKTLSYIVQRNIWNRFTMTDEPTCCNRPPTDGGSNPDKKPIYGLKLTKITCHEHDEVGGDHIYVVSVVVDGKGQLRAETSALYDMNEDDDDVVYPNKWLYPMNDPGGFLDSAIQLWEDDGGYAEAAKAISAVGKAIGAIPGKWTKVAGIALQAIGGLLSLTNWLDDDDKFGEETKTWSSSLELESGVGTYKKSFVNYDTGIFDFTSYNYDLQFELLTANT